jgi:GAF domain-containing protein
MLRGDELLGVINVVRYEVRPFSDSEIALMETFADQAAIAIENARLLTELQAKNADLTEALEQQTATSEILRVISSSPGDVKPMLNAVAERALMLCDAAQATIVLVDGDALRCAAAFGKTGTLQEGELMPLTPGSVAGRAIHDGAPFQIEDLAAASEEEFPVGRDLQRRIGHHAIDRPDMEVPPAHFDDRAEGAVVRAAPRGFDDVNLAPHEGVSGEHPRRAARGTHVLVVEMTDRTIRIALEAIALAIRDARNLAEIASAFERAKELAERLVAFAANDDVDAEFGRFVHLRCETRVVSANDDGRAGPERAHESDHAPGRVTLKRHHRQADHVGLMAFHQAADGGGHSVLDEDQVRNRDVVMRVDIAGQRGQRPVRHAHRKRRRMLE